MKNRALDSPSAFGVTNATNQTSRKLNIQALYQIVDIGHQLKTKIEKKLYLNYWGSWNNKWNHGWEVEDKSKDVSNHWIKYKCKGNHQINAYLRTSSEDISYRRMNTKSHILG